jgi:hypothetical protein
MASGFSDRIVVPSIVATGVASSGSSSAVTLPSIVASGVAASGIGGSSTVTLPFIQASGTSPVQVASSNILPFISATGVALPGVMGSSIVVLPSITSGAFGYEPAVGISAVVLPFVQASGIALRGTGATFSAVVMHTESAALSTFSNYQFNSFAKMFGQYFAAGDAGLFTLGGSTDAGAPINSVARLGITDFGSAHLKRVERLYMGYRAEKDMLVRVYTDEVNIRDYRLVATGKAGLHGNHVRLGRGLEARYWQFEVQNIAGGDFDFNMIECRPIELARRVGKDDA